MAESNNMNFVPMTSISKKPDTRAHKCSDWVATEKVHGSSFQMYSKDGVKVSQGSRRRNLDDTESFVKCNIKNLLEEYKEYALKTWHIIHSGDRWEEYREPSTEYKNEEDDEDDDGDDDDADNDGEVATTESESGQCEDQSDEICRVRIYGELYGGGGVQKSTKSAVQKEIIYCDEFRFYVFGLTINKKWVTIHELNDICREAGFPYYAKPVCEPKKTIDELKEHLVESGFMRSKSALTEKTDDDKTFIEGVVMTPLKRPDFELHAVKFLAPDFNDVRDAQFGKTKTANFCTKQRYHSVISKLDIHERNDTKMVVDMFINDIIKESPDKNPNNKLKGVWAKLVLDWLREDEYNVDDSILAEYSTHPNSNKNKQNREDRRDKEEEEKKRAVRKSQRKENNEEEDEPLDFDFFGL